MYDLKKFDLKYATADKLISKKPCVIGGVFLSQTASGVGTITLHNGFNANDEIKAALTVATYIGEAYNFVIPIFFSKGLFVEASSDVVAYSIQVCELLDSKDTSYLL